MKHRDREKMRENGVGEGGVNRRGEIEKGMEGGNDIEKKRVGEAVLFPKFSAVVLFTALSPVSHFSLSGSVPYVPPGQISHPVTGI
jgi:hypothetical protein